MLGALKVCAPKRHNHWAILAENSDFGRKFDSYGVPVGCTYWGCGARIEKSQYGLWYPV